jgi:radical SAM protein with 4Fe4S-binding SPASM domain
MINNNQNLKKKFERQIHRIIMQVRYLEHLDVISPNFPQHIHIEPTNACNLRCIHCVQEAMTRPRGLMELSTFTRVIDEISPLQCSITLDVQGEPLIHPQALDMVHYAKNAGCHTSLLTNATLLTEEKSRALVGMGLDRIVFSFDAVEKKRYENIRRRSRYERNIMNLLKFLRINLENGRSVFVCVSIIHQEATADHLHTYKEYFSHLPVDTIFVSELLNMSGFSSVSKEINFNAIKHKNKHEPLCRVPWENITVNWNGDVCPCPLDFNVLWPVGNVNQTSLKDLWNSPEFQKFRLGHLQNDLNSLDRTSKLCSTCNCRYDSEYDLHNYVDFAEKSIVRKSEQCFGKQVNNELAQSTTEVEVFPSLYEKIETLQDAIS